MSVMPAGSRGLQRIAVVERIGDVDLERGRDHRDQRIQLGFGIGPDQEVAESHVVVEQGHVLGIGRDVDREETVDIKPVQSCRYSPEMAENSSC